jgi:hypothetical protein
MLEEGPGRRSDYRALLRVRLTRCHLVSEFEGVSLIWGRRDRPLPASLLASEFHA